MNEPKPTILMSSLDDIHGFLDDAHRDPAIAAAVTDLIVDMTTMEAAPLYMLHQSLSIVPNLVDLILLLPPGVPEDFLDGFSYHALRLFKTNIPHRCLSSFMESHPTLTTLCLDSCECAEPVCPLCTRDFNAIVTLECPLGCLHKNPCHNLVRLTAGQRSSTCGIPAAFKAFPAAASLVYLTVEFLPDDYDVLQGIVGATPMLRKLKLLEQHRVTRRRSHARRAWNDFAGWSRCLLKLPHLEELALRTAAAFGRVAANVNPGATILLSITSVCGIVLVISATGSSRIGPDITVTGLTVSSASD
ncbi:hypothetical protein L226DRAFT_573248 [Lentinus tigrinus ALCF2SS1-7]|uniref:Uncharacterized protein n=1 Tax=Lentinus tigrinus ALCF2SS1-6 TaxID=1328759 RepID=A0A5C2S582_9APHY|nr:hypothetical protein L227DRAFT_613196 [Lentinus tigrinus ALCF2SS1-6]RPD72179.1 hypothetical protein L226DRAFT_573248 [Lentinus tigrinus ALCF2SS1-7]